MPVAEGLVAQLNDLLLRQVVILLGCVESIERVSHGTGQGGCGAASCSRLPPKLIAAADVSGAPPSGFRRQDHEIHADDEFERNVPRNRPPRLGASPPLHRFELILDQQLSRAVAA